MNTNIQTYIKRMVGPNLEHSLGVNPVTALVGPRQSGKSTLVRHVLQARPEALILDLELPSDLRKLEQAEYFLKENSNRLVCIDEVQHQPGLFPLLRALVDQDRRAGRFLVLGSASRDLIRQSTETLAGRIHYIELTPLRYEEVGAGGDSGSVYRRHWWRGGFPPAFLADDDSLCRAWLQDFIQTFLSRDIPQFGFSIPALALHRFWMMLAHYHGGVLNTSKIGQSLDISHNTVRRYIDILEQAFMVRVLRSVGVNTKKRLVKSPKVYIRDSGLLHALLEVESQTELFGHPAYGGSWEGWCIEQICVALPEWRPGYYRTSSGEEMDLVLEKGMRRLVFEFKASAAPHVSRGFAGSLKVLAPEQTWIVCPVEQGYDYRPGVRVVSPREVLREIAPMQ